MSEMLLPYDYYPDPTKGRPVFNGSIFVGEPGTDPTIGGNQIAVSARQEDGSEVSITQPISTNAGGMPTYNGRVVTLLISQLNYSILVQNSSGSQVYEQSNAEAKTSISDVTANSGKIFDSVSSMTSSTSPDLVLGASLSTQSFYAGWAATIMGPVGGANYVIVTKAEHDTVRGTSTVDELGDHTLTTGDVALLIINNKVNVRQFGAVGKATTDDNPSIQAAVDVLKSFVQTYDYAETGNLTHSDSHEGIGGTVFFPKGVYAIDTEILLQSSTDNWSITFEGEETHASVVMVRGTGTNGFNIVGTGGDGMRSVAFRNIKIRGDQNGGAWPSLSGDAIRLDHCGKQIAFERVWIDHMGGHGINIDDVCNMITLKDCRISYCDQGIRAINNAEQMWLYGNSIRFCTTAVFIGGFNNILNIYGGDVHGNTTGINVFSGANAENTSITIDGVYLESNEKDILVGGGSGAGTNDRPRNVIIRGNSITAPAVAGNNCIEISAGVGCIIKGNEFRNMLTNKPANLIRLASASEKTEVGLNSFEEDGIDFLTTNYMSNVGVENFGYIDNDDRNHWINDRPVSMQNAFALGNSVVSEIASGQLSLVAAVRTTVQAETGTADTLDFIEIPNEPGRMLILSADTGDTITVTDNASSPPAGFAAIQGTAGGAVLDSNDQLTIVYSPEQTKWNVTGDQTN